MNNQAIRVNQAIEEMHRPGCIKAHNKVLAAEENRGPVTITINETELELLRKWISSAIGQEHQVWYDITHDEQIDVHDMAYEMAESVLREDWLHRMWSKLPKA